MPGISQAGNNKQNWLPEGIGSSWGNCKMTLKTNKPILTPDHEKRLFIL